MSIQGLSHVSLVTSRTFHDFHVLIFLKTNSQMSSYPFILLRILENDYTVIITDQEPYICLFQCICNWKELLENKIILCFFHQWRFRYPPTFSIIKPYGITQVNTLCYSAPNLSNPPTLWQNMKLKHKLQDMRIYRANHTNQAVNVKPAWCPPSKDTNMCITKIEEEEYLFLPLYSFVLLIYSPPRQVQHTSPLRG